MSSSWASSVHSTGSCIDDIDHGLKSTKFRYAYVRFFACDDGLLIGIRFLFCLLLLSGEDKSECRKCVKVLQELENIDDDADQLGIAMVKLNDPDLADEYSLGTLPAMVYYRRRIPVVYDGEKDWLTMNLLWPKGFSKAQAKWNRFTSAITVSLNVSNHYQWLLITGTPAV